ncbi:MAG: cysteine desulfurase [Lachnospiraceae bacterium]|nr:cysteine desulfurase [Lachnospiraceae bacterium]
MIYLDNAATAPMKRGAYEKMLPYLTRYYGNPASACGFAKKSHEAMEQARAQCASLIGAAKDEIYFTSGGTESDNWAIKGAAVALRDKGRHIITTRIEHNAVLATCRELERMGYKVTYLDVDEYGMVSLRDVKRAIGPDTILISVMMANNEIGTLQPIEEIGRLAHSKGIWFHTDAVQACGHIDIDVDRMHIDMLSASGHKFGGPKGIGFLYMRKGIELPPFVHGGGQESGKRSGTGNVPAAVAMGEAAHIYKMNMHRYTKYVTELREYAVKRILNEIPFVRLNGHRVERLPGNMNFSFEYVDGGKLLSIMDREGICASAGSACSAKNRVSSHVLKSIGLPDDIAHGTLRLTISEENTRQEIDTAITILKRAVYKLRENVPEYIDIRKDYKW